MNENELFEDIRFADADETLAEELSALIAAAKEGRVAEAGGLAVAEGDDEDETASTPTSVYETQMIRLFNSSGAGCRHAAPPSDTFKVTHEDGIRLVVRCGHDPYHEWIDGVRTK